VSISAQPTYFFMTVDYTEPRTVENPTEADYAATRATYRGVRLRIEYGQDCKAVKVFNTGEFASDYQAAVTHVQTLSGEREVPFMGSSTVDSYMYDAGYEEAV
jgi:hypothetical protein